MTRNLRLYTYFLLAPTGLVGGYFYLFQFHIFAANLPHLTVLDAVMDSALGNPLRKGFLLDAIHSGIAFLVWLIHEAKSLSMRHRWLYVVLIFTTPLAFALPAYLFMRERGLAALGWE